VILTIKISDELYEKIGKLNPQNPRHAIEKLLAKYADAGYSTKAVVLSGTDLAEVQKIIGQVDDPASFLAALKKVTTLNVGDFKIGLTESQIKNLERNNQFWAEKDKDWMVNQIKRGLQATLGV
jgi:hypothetical protein